MILGCYVLAADMEETSRLWTTIDAWWPAIEVLVTTRVTNARTEAANTGINADDLNALLATHRVPVRHRIRVRTTNLAERSFVEERRRTNVIGRFPDEKAAMKLVFATMIRSADRWCRVSITNPERHQLKLLRADLGLDPPPAGTDNRTTTRRRNVAA
jgi:hypothetical protein